MLMDFLAYHLVGIPFHILSDGLCLMASVFDIYFYEYDNHRSLSLIISRYLPLFILLTHTPVCNSTWFCMYVYTKVVLLYECRLRHQYATVPVAFEHLASSEIFFSIFNLLSEHPQGASPFTKLWIVNRSVITHICHLTSTPLI